MKFICPSSIICIFSYPVRNVKRVEINAEQNQEESLQGGLLGALFIYGCFYLSTTF